MTKYNVSTNLANGWQDTLYMAILGDALQVTMNSAGLRFDSMIAVKDTEYCYALHITLYLVCLSVSILVGLPFALLYCIYDSHCTLSVWYCIQ